MANFLKSFFPPFLHSNPNIFVVVSIVFTLLLIENLDAGVGYSDYIDQNIENPYEDGWD
jgi:hypothetical protein